MVDLFLLPLIAGLGIISVTGPLGSFIVWRRMAYFGDALAHSALLGVAIGLWLKIDLMFGSIVGCLVISLLLTTLQRQRQLETDALLGILSPASLSLGLIAISSFKNIRVDLVSFLFGDILSVTKEDIIGILICAIFILGVLLTQWRSLLSITIHEELAQVEGLPVGKLRLTLIILIAVTIALSMKIVGVLLITSLLVIPAATARNVSRTPESMAFFASTFGALAVLAGLIFSYYFDSPAGPSIVVAATSFFALSLAVRSLQKNNY